MHVSHQLGLASLCSRSADALADRDAYTSRLALERPNDQFVAVMKIEADPVQLWQRLEKQRTEVGGIGNAVAFVTEQGLGLFSQQGILRGLVQGLGGSGEIEHAWAGIR